MKKLILTGCLLILIYISTNAAIINVPADQPTIQAGLDSASYSDTVLVAEGTYYENIVWPGTDGIQLFSDKGAVNTIIDGNGVDRVVFIHSSCSVTNATVIDGFTIQNGYNGGSPGPGAGIADYCGIIIKNNIIKNNNANGLGAGLLLAGGTPLIFNNLIINNTCGDAGGGMCIAFCEAEIRNNTIESNYADNVTGGGGIFYMYGSGTQILEDNIIVNNSAINSYLGGGGILVYSSAYSFDYNNVWDNKPDNYSGCSAGTNSISENPIFISGYNEDYFLNQSTSPCVNAGSQTAINANLNDLTTAPDLSLDIDQVDIGFHYNPDDFSHLGIYDNSIHSVKTLSHSNSPNPFFVRTTINYHLTVSANVSLIIYNYLGQKIRTLVNEYQSTGNHSVIWDGTTNTGESVSSGIYLYQININNSSIFTKKIILF